MGLQVTRVWSRPGRLMGVLNPQPVHPSPHPDLRPEGAGRRWELGPGSAVPLPPGEGSPGAGEAGPCPALRGGRPGRSPNPTACPGDRVPSPSPARTHLRGLAEALPGGPLRSPPPPDAAGLGLLPPGSRAPANSQHYSVLRDFFFFFFVASGRLPGNDRAIPQ